MSLLICLLFWGYAKSAGYEVRFRLADWIKVMLSLTGVIFCILGAEYLIQSFWDYELSLEKDTVSYGNVESVYQENRLPGKGQKRKVMEPGRAQREQQHWY